MPAAIHHIEDRGHFIPSGVNLMDHGRSRLTFRTARRVATRANGRGHVPVTLQQLLGISLPIIQDPMAGVQGSALTVAVSNAGGLGSLPCAMLGLDDVRRELMTIRAQTTNPFNVNFFCHTQPEFSAERESVWRTALAPYFAEFGIDPNTIPSAPARVPFNSDAAEVLGEFKPPVVSVHFGLPSADLLAQVRGWGARIVSSATTVDEARWLEARGVDAIIAQGLEAAGR